MKKVKVEEISAGEMIRTVRLEKGITGNELAKRAGVSAAAISRWERGRRTPSITDFQKVMAALGSETAIIQK